MSAQRPRVTARLYTPPAAWGLPTVDADGLSCHALLRFAAIPYSEVAGGALGAADAPITVLQRAAGAGAGSPGGGAGGPPTTAHGLSGLIGTLASDPRLPDPNPALTPFMAAESTAFATLVAARFAPARAHEFFLKDANYADLWHAALAAADPFPLNRIVPARARRHVRDRFAAAGKTPAEAYFDAGIALAALATRLGDRARFFYGDRPSVLDAVVFGQLATVLLAPLPDAQLRAMVAAHPNLVQYVLRIRRDFFPDEGEGAGEGAGAGAPSRGSWGADLDADTVAAGRRAAAERRAAEAQAKARPHGSSAGKPQSAGADAADAAEESEDDRRIRHNWYFLYGAVAVFAGHILFGSEIELELGAD